MEQLASLANVKAWLGDTVSTSDDAQLTRLIQQASSFILNYIQWTSFFKSSVTEIKDGLGSVSTVLEQWPVTGVQTLYVGGQGTASIPAQPSLPQSGPGYFLEPWDGRPPGKPQALQLNGYFFPPGIGNIQVNYTSGFYIASEAATVPASVSYTVAVQAPYGNWGRDDGVTLANGTVLTKVTGAPAALQYAVANGVYTFNAAQASAAVLISYSYIPPEIEQACIEIVGERYRYSKRIGQQSVTAAGQVTSSFSLKGMQEYVVEILDRYKRSFYAC